MVVCEKSALKPGTDSGSAEPRLNFWGATQVWPLWPFVWKTWK